uniref:Butyrophilin subfamily 1 member A1 n=1 Tax=Podarcis muralis TaxID=64176 RepID=A0A670JFS4_PODMU
MFGLKVGRFVIIPPENPIVGFLGKDVILPCQLTTSSIPESTSMQVQWILDKSSEKIDVKSYYGRNRPETQDNRYRGRAELSRTDLSKGNMSLILKKTHLSDQGNYTCIVFLGDWYDEVVVELVLAAKGTEPTIALVGYKGWGISLTCSSNGWYPKPKAFWLVSEGKVRSKQSDTTITETKAGNFTVSSSIITDSGVDHEVSCKIINELLEMESESRILISGDINQFLLYITKGLYNGQQRRKRNSCSSFFQLYPFFFFAANVVLDPKTAHPRLNVSDGKCFWDTGNISKVPNCEERFDSHTFVLAKECFSKGRHYWEVEVGEKRKWDLGVASEFAHRKGEITLSPQNGYWVIGLEGRKNYWARTEQWTYLKVSGKPTKIGIFLNMPAGSLCFYDVHNNRKLYTFSICCSGKLYPFFSTGSVAAELDSQPLKISPWLKEDDTVEEDGKKANISEMAQD